MKYSVLLILTILCSALLGNSVFSFDGMPVKYYGNDVYGLGMGDTGNSDLHRINPNFSNPSIAVSTNKVLFSTAASLGYTWYEDDLGNSFKDDGIFLPFFQVAIPILNHRFAFSFNSVSSGNLENERETEWATSSGDTLSYSETNRLSSNIYKGDLIYAYKNPILNIGASINYYLGHRVRYWKMDFADGNYTDTKYEIEKLFKNPGFTLGASKKIGGLSLSAAYSSAVDLDGDVELKYGHSPYADTLSLADDFLFQIPAKVSGGFTYKFLEKYKLSTEMHYEMWEGTEQYDKNTLKIGAGFAYDPLSGYGSWYERIPLRFGGYMRELPFEKNNEKIIEQALTFGTSIILKSANKKIDLAVQYLTRGDVDANGLNDTSLMFTIGITGFDIFRKQIKKIEDREIPKADGRLVE
ncbi:hypothetical protein ACFLYJ_03525 [Candidatus Cloacimonadota bacterium]